ncbi:MAG: alpha/beta hydrolase [Desulfobacterales bacterium]
MRKDVTFLSDGMTCKGWFYLPDDLRENQKVPVVIMAHGFSAVKEHYLSRYAERFVSSGMAVLVFDYRYLGESEGEPRGQVLPHTQLNDYRNALSWVCRQAEVDPDRLGVWGTSYSGGHVLHLGAFDRRIKAVVSQVPNICGWRSVLKSSGMEGLRFLQEMVVNDRLSAYPDEIRYLPVVAPEGEPAALGTPDAYAFFHSGEEKAAENWINKVSLESIEKMIESNPADAIEIISPTPLMIVAAVQDFLIPIEIVREAFERAGEPKKLVEIPCGHFDVYYASPWHEQAVEAADQWFRKHLLETGV